MSTHYLVKYNKSYAACGIVDHTHTQQINRLMPEPPTQGIIYPSHRGCSPPKTFLTPQHRPPTEGVNSSYTYPDGVYTILSYRRLLE